MADATSIEWTQGADGRPGATWNIITGCSLESPGCTNCYAMRLAGTRLKHIPSRAGLTQETKAGPVWNGKVRFNEEWLTQPLRWTRARNIFVCAHGDLFHENVPDEWIDQVLAVMHMAPHHTFQVLTKRSKRMRDYFAARTDGDPWAEASDAVANALGMEEHQAVLEPRHMPLPNVWLGVSVEDQTRADERIPHLMATPAAIRWLSCEPLLGPVDLGRAWHGESSLDPECWGKCGWCEAGHPPLHNCQRGKGDWERGRSGIDWVVCGGEKAKDFRLLDPDWSRSLRDQCKEAGVPFFKKQMSGRPGAMPPIPDDLNVREFPAR